ncbi:hypothetical protein EFA59_02495 [Weissella hellenica]|nr:hypothetical protein EFA59_02495 [Weissella hellenica]
MSNYNQENISENAKRLLKNKSGEIKKFMSTYETRSMPKNKSVETPEDHLNFLEKLKENDEEN